MRLIDADHLKRWILSRVFKTQLSVADVIDQIDREDNIEPEPKTGRWIENEKQIHVEKMYHCSECGFNAWGRYEKTKFCGGCGLRMENAYEGFN